MSFGTFECRESEIKKLVNEELGEKLKVYNFARSHYKFIKFIEINIREIITFILLHISCSSPYMRCINPPLKL